MVREAMATGKIEVHQGLSEWRCRSCEEVDTGVSNMGAVAQIQGTQLGCVAQQEPQGGVCELQACQAQLGHPLQPPTTLCLPWFGVWWRQQQLSELGVLNILNPTEVQEPKGWQWG